MKISASRVAMLSSLFGVMAMTAAGIEITEPMKTICLMIISFYFGKGISPDATIDQNK